MEVNAGRRTARLEGRVGDLVSEGSSRARVWHLGRLAVALGLAGTTLMAVTGPRLVGGSATWWYSIHVPPGRAGNMTGFYLGVVALCAAWLALGRRIARTPEVRTGEVVAVAAIWILPLVLGPALFSGDMYSYLAQGTILHLGLDPYRDAPDVLRHVGRTHVLDAVSPFWRGTTAPYGPLFLGLVSGVVGLTGSNLVAGVVAVRLLEVAGLALLAVFVPRLARGFGADPSRAAWIALMSPLALAQLVAAGHNDALMAGLMVAGVALALEQRPLAGVALCALAATVKVPAAAAIVFIAVARARTLDSRAARVRLVASVGALGAAVAAAVSVFTGTGLRWVSGAVLATPAKVHLAITPVTALAWTVSRVLGGVGVVVDYAGLDRVLGYVAIAATVAVAVDRIVRTREERLVLDLGTALCVAALLGPAAWPWYFSWGIVLLAAWPGFQRSRLPPLVLAASVLLVKPDGIVAVPLQASPATLACYVAAGALAVASWRRRSPGARRAGTARRAEAAPAGS